MRPIPVAFHVWFLEVHTYGIGLALTFWFGLRFTERRLRRAGYPWQWVTGMFVWVIIAAIVGARALHVVSNLSFYSHNPGQILAIWQGGLSSFGGLLFAVPVAIVEHPSAVPAAAHPPLRRPHGTGAHGVLGHRPAPGSPADGGRRRTPDRPVVRDVLRRPGGQAAPGADLPGNRGPHHLRHPSSGRAVAAPVRTRRRGDRGGWSPGPTLLPPSGIVLGVGMVLWGVERFLDEHLWLGEDGHLGSVLVQAAGIALAVAGAILLISRIGPLQRWRRGEGGDPGPEPIGTSDGQQTLEEDVEDVEDGADGEDGEESDDAATPTPVPSTAPSHGSVDG